MEFRHQAPRRGWHPASFLSLPHPPPPPLGGEGLPRLTGRRKNWAEQGHAGHSSSLPPALWGLPAWTAEVLFCTPSHPRYRDPPPPSAPQEPGLLSGPHGQVGRHHSGARPHQAAPRRPEHCRPLNLAGVKLTAFPSNHGTCTCPLLLSRTSLWQETGAFFFK